ncbi:hypothetical protein QTO34_006080 [Cnephaeus nilssonii]|uniref:Uncharacterized protein n=1 Tax=Cnephaeus nilssonii TaxID=3371016 RepID=A0AA40HM18_CNENI|nr:hypothetical protein QTO34_006080 [Eptesicus nilssonii]
MALAPLAPPGQTGSESLSSELFHCTCRKLAQAFKELVSDTEPGVRGLQDPLEGSWFHVLRPSESLWRGGGFRKALCRRRQTDSSPALAFDRGGAGRLSAGAPGLPKASGAAKTQTLSSRCHWRCELSVLLAQSATPATLSPAPCASCWPNRGHSGVMAPIGLPPNCHGGSTALWGDRPEIPGAPLENLECGSLGTAFQLREGRTLSGMLLRTCPYTFSTDTALEVILESCQVGIAKFWSYTCLKEATLHLQGQLPGAQTRAENTRGHRTRRKMRSEDNQPGERIGKLISEELIWTKIKIATDTLGGQTQPFHYIKDMAPNFTATSRRNAAQVPPARNNAKPCLTLARDLGVGAQSKRVSILSQRHLLFFPEKLLLRFCQALPQPRDHLHSHVHLSVQGPLSSLNFPLFLSQLDKSGPDFQQFCSLLGQLFGEFVDPLLDGPVHGLDHPIEFFSDVGLESSFGVGGGESGTGPRPIQRVGTEVHCGVGLHRAGKDPASGVPALPVPASQQASPPVSKWIREHTSSCRWGGEAQLPPRCGDWDLLPSPAGPLRRAPWAGPQAQMLRHHHLPDLLLQLQPLLLLLLLPLRPVLLRERGGFQQSRKSASRARSHPRAPGRRHQPRPGRSVARAGGSDARGCGGPRARRADAPGAPRSRGDTPLCPAAGSTVSPPPHPRGAGSDPVFRGERRRDRSPRGKGGKRAGLRGAALSPGPGKLFCT